MHMSAGITGKICIPNFEATEFCNAS
jgi:hypothetical protein